MSEVDQLNISIIRLYLYAHRAYLSTHMAPKILTFASCCFLQIDTSVTAQSVLLNTLCIQLFFSWWFDLTRLTQHCLHYRVHKTVLNNLPMLFCNLLWQSNYLHCLKSIEFYSLSLIVLIKIWHDNIKKKKEDFKYPSHILLCY